MHVVLSDSYGPSACILKPRPQTAMWLTLLTFELPVPPWTVQVPRQHDFARQLVVCSIARDENALYSPTRGGGGGGGGSLKMNVL